MKKLLSLILALALAYSLAACAAKSADTDTGAAASNAAVTAEKVPDASTDKPAAEDAKAAGSSSSASSFGGEDKADSGVPYTAVTGGREGDDGMAYPEAEAAGGSLYMMDSMPAESFAAREPAFAGGEIAGFSKSSKADSATPEAVRDPGSVGIIDDPVAPVVSDDPPVDIDDPIVVVPPPVEYDPGRPFVLTAAEWNDNLNWPFFTNLVNAGLIAFPSFGLDPVHRIKVATDTPYAPIALVSEGGEEPWRAEADRDGTAYLFYRDGDSPYAVRFDGADTVLETERVSDGTAQGLAERPQQEVTLTGGASGEKDGLQVMFIVDTTGSMSDEIAYLQMDFSDIAAEVGSDGVTYSVCFYRDEGDDYVTKLCEFTDNVSAVQDIINGEYAAGGGDTPEAVAQILSETLTMSFMNEDGHAGWQPDTAKLAFLIFDAPPHEGTEETIIAAVKNAAEAGIRVVPVVASNAERETELFGRALAILTGGTYVFLTDDSGIGDSHLEPIVGAYDVELLHDIIVRLIEDARP